MNSPSVVALLDQLAEARGVVCDRSDTTETAYDALRGHADVTTNLALDGLAAVHDRRRDLLTDNQTRRDVGILDLMTALTVNRASGEPNIEALLSRIRSAQLTCAELVPVVQSAYETFVAHTLRALPELKEMKAAYDRHRAALHEAEAAERVLVCRLLDQLCPAEAS